MYNRNLLIKYFKRKDKNWECPLDWTNMEAIGDLGKGTSGSGEDQARLEWIQE